MPHLLKRFWIAHLLYKYIIPLKTKQCQRKKKRPNHLFNNLLSLRDLHCIYAADAIYTANFKLCFNSSPVEGKKQCARKCWQLHNLYGFVFASFGNIKYLKYNLHTKIYIETIIAIYHNSKFPSSSSSSTTPPPHRSLHHTHTTFTNTIHRYRESCFRWHSRAAFHLIIKFVIVLHTKINHKRYLVNAQHEKRQQCQATSQKYLAQFLCSYRYLYSISRSHAPSFVFSFPYFFFSCFHCARVFARPW